MVVSALPPFQVVALVEAPVEALVVALVVAPVEAPVEVLVEAPVEAPVVAQLVLVAWGRGVGHRLHWWCSSRRVERDRADSAQMEGARHQATRSKGAEKVHVEPPMVSPQLRWDFLG